MKRAAIYIRTATTSQAGNQLQQFFSNQAHILRSGTKVKIREVYQDNGASGSNLNRPGLNALLRDAITKQIDIIYTADPTRLSRNQLELKQLLASLKKLSVEVVFTRA